MLRIPIYILCNRTRKSSKEKKSFIVSVLQWNMHVYQRWSRLAATVIVVIAVSSKYIDSFR